MGPDGEIETIEGTPTHPVWSIDKQDWIGLGDLEPGERLKGEDGPARVLEVAVHHRAIPVYNIEVHGEHVYQVGHNLLLVHNAGKCTGPGGLGHPGSMASAPRTAVDAADEALAAGKSRGAAAQLDVNGQRFTDISGAKPDLHPRVQEAEAR